MRTPCRAALIAVYNETRSMADLECASIIADPRSIQAHASRGVLLTKWGNVAAAISSFDAALVLVHNEEKRTSTHHPLGALAYYNRGNAYSTLRLGNRESNDRQAMRDYQAALERRPSFLKLGVTSA